MEGRGCLDRWGVETSVTDTFLIRTLLKSAAFSNFEGCASASYAILRVYTHCTERYSILDDKVRVKCSSAKLQFQISSRHS